MAALEYCSHKSSTCLMTTREEYDIVIANDFWMEAYYTISSHLDMI